jgi:hypothetical protein
MTPKRSAAYEKAEVRDPFSVAQRYPAGNAKMERKPSGLWPQKIRLQLAILREEIVGSRAYRDACPLYRVWLWQVGSGGCLGACLLHRAAGENRYDADQICAYKSHCQPR